LSVVVLPAPLAEEPDALAFLDREADAVDRLDDLVLATHERLERRREAGWAAVHLEVLRQLLRADHLVGSGLLREVADGLERQRVD
jgi:hypothetical protein